MLDAALSDQLRSHFAKISRPVRLVASLDESETATEMRALLEELASLSPSVTLDLSGHAPRRPSFSVASEATGERVRFAGLPLGHEFTSLVLAILQVGGHPPVLGEGVAEQAARVGGPLHFETYFSQSCQNCPVVVQALNALAVLNPDVSHEAIDGGPFRAEVEAREVLAVPTVFLNGELFASGRLEIEEILARLGGAGAASAAARLAETELDVLVVGGGPAGAAAAVYAARKGIRTALVAERLGGQVLDTDAIENLVSVIHTTGPSLAADLEAHVRSYGVEVLKGLRAVGLAESDGLPVVEFEGGSRVRARSVILATGARWRRLGVPGEEELLNRGVTFCPHCDGPLFKGRRVVVVGGGNSGVEAAIDLAGVVAHVTLLEFEDALRADAVLQRKVRSLPNVDVVLGAQTTEVVGERAMTGLRYVDRASGQTRLLEAEGLFVQIGLVPNTEWLAGSLALSDRGEIVVDDRGATSAAGVFAAGDCTTVPFKQIVVALGSGSTAALSAFDHLIRSSAPSEDEESLAGVG